jgi:hypothetical protein
MIITSCRIVYSTKEENSALEKERKAKQKNTKRCILPWREMYSKLNLQPSTKKQRQQNTIVIAEKTYASAAIASEHINVTVKEIKRRCNSKSVKWNSWKEIKMSSDA